MESSRRDERTGDSLIGFTALVFLVAWSAFGLIATASIPGYPSAGGMLLFAAIVVVPVGLGVIGLAINARERSRYWSLLTWAGAGAGMAGALISQVAFSPIFLLGPILLAVAAVIADQRRHNLVRLPVHVIVAVLAGLSYNALIFLPFRLVFG